MQNLKPIPVLGVPILNRGDLLERLVQSIDYPVQKLHIINNGTDAGVQDAIHRIQHTPHEHIGTVHVYYPTHNLGVAASWNRFITDNTQAPWWMITANDMLFGSGTLAKVAETMYAPENADIGMAYVDGYAMFIATPLAVEKVGMFDENFYPAYYEDGDHYYRSKLSGIRMEGIKAVFVHGEHPNWGSHTIASDARLAEANKITFEMNKEYFISKWGGMNGEEKFTTPFNNAELPITHWQKDDQRLQQMQAIWSKR